MSRILVTGASSGIGKALCVLLHKDYEVIQVARRKELMDPKLGRVIQLDIQDRQKVMETLNFEVDVVVNNAGLALGTDVLEQTLDSNIDAMLDTNVKGLLNVTKAVLPQMKKRNSGHVVNIGSIAGDQAYHGGSVYCASKHAVRAISDSLRIELVNTNIRVTHISPGMVETNFSNVRGSKNVYDGMEPLTAMDVAESILFAISRPKHCQISSMTLLPTSQASAYHVFRN